MPSADPERGATVGHLVWTLSMRWRAAVDRAVAPLGLTHAQYTVLSSLRAAGRTGPDPTQRELADHVTLDAVYVSKLLLALERAGLVERRPDPVDRRAVRVALTATGRSVADRAIPIVHTLLDDLVEPFGGQAAPRTRRFARDLSALLGKVG